MSSSWPRPSRAARLVSLAVVLVLAGYYAYGHYLTPPSVASRIRDSLGADSCRHVGVMPFAGTQTDVYRCSSAASSRCYVRAHGSVYDVTPTIAVLRKIKATGVGRIRCG